jgi:HTH-type transcriptional regulator/antitoxin HigA
MIKLIVQLFKTLIMAKINTEIQYEKALERIEELLLYVDNQTSENDKSYIELDLLSDLVAEYEEKYYPVEKPTLPSIIRLRMAELKISQKKLATLLNVSPSRISEYLNGKSEPTLKIARLLRDELKIDADIILG